MANPSSLLIGCAAGFSGDRLDAAAPVVQALVDSGRPAVLIFETLAERTLALAQLARRADPGRATSRCSTTCCAPCSRSACATACAS